MMMKTELIVLGALVGATIALFGALSETPSQTKTAPTVHAGRPFPSQPRSGDAFDAIEPDGAFAGVRGDGAWVEAEASSAGAPAFTEETADALDVVIPPDEKGDAGQVPSTVAEGDADAGGVPASAEKADAKAPASIALITVTAGPRHIERPSTRSTAPPAANPAPNSEIEDPYTPAPPKREVRGRCPKGRVECAGGVCANTRTDPDNCGECGLACGPGLHNTVPPTCRNGQCTVGVCEPGWTSCDDIPGCETDVTAPDHCGSCANRCPTISISGRARQLACVNGACQLPPGIAQCGGAYADLATSREHCGTCGRACADWQNCVNGRCVCADVTNCGAEI